MAKKLKYRGVRKFIDNREADSYIHVTADDDDYALGYNVKLADCNRHISLYFPAKTSENRKRSLKKLDNVLKPLLAIKAELERLEGEGA